MNEANYAIEAQIEEIGARLNEAKALANDPEMAELAAEEIKGLEAQKSALEISLKSINQEFESSASNAGAENMDTSNAILEVRGGTGGEEAKLFGEDLLRMYVRFAELNRFKIEILDEGVVKIKGRGAYGIFKYEAGVHRVQRVPTTESSGRIHTSTASVAVLPEITARQIEIRDEDLEWKFTRAGGHGGQNVNKVNTAVLLTHRPSGIVVSCRQERFQQQNREIALDLLRGRLWEIEEKKRLSEIESARSVIGRGMRAEKIRTYNYPENRITDHRIKKTWHNLDRIIEGGDLKMIIDALKEADANPEATNDNEADSTE